jgi:hypothetical protein
MAKKSKASVEEKTITSENEVYIPVPGEGIIDFYYLFGGIGILTGIMFIIFIPIHYVYHIL